MLENEFAVGDADAFRVFGLRGDVGDLVRQDVAGGVFHGDALEERAGERGVHLRPRHHDGFGGAGDGEVVGDRDGHRLGSEQSGSGGEREKKGGEFHGTRVNGEGVVQAERSGGKRDRAYGVNARGRFTA